MYLTFGIVSISEKTEKMLETVWPYENWPLGAHDKSYEIL